MRIVTTHTNTDFDALASMVACTSLYPGTIAILPSHVMPCVKAFLAIHMDLLRIKPRKQLDIDTVDSLIVVDANSWKRLDRMEELAKKDDLEIIAWDHHMEGVTIESSITHREEMGATVTLLLEEMERQDTPFTPMQATLFLLGIYHDTGGLAFSSSTPRDVRMVAFLLENGADLNVVAAYLSDTIDDSHSEVFSNMLTVARSVEMDGLKIGICAQPVRSGLTMLAALVAKYKEFKGLDAAFGIFLTDNSKVMVIARGNPQGIDVGAVVRALGGGGHPAAGSAVVKGTTLEATVERVEGLIGEVSQRDIPVQEIMSASERFVVASSHTMAEAKKFMEAERLNGVLVCERKRFLGALSGETFVKAEKSSRMDTSVKGFMNVRGAVLAPTDSVRGAVELMSNSEEGILPVVKNGLLIGVLTRGNLVLHIYDAF